MACGSPQWYAESDDGEALLPQNEPEAAILDAAATLLRHDATLKSTPLVGAFFGSAGRYELVRGAAGALLQRNISTGSMRHMVSAAPWRYQDDDGVCLKPVGAIESAALELAAQRLTGYGSLVGEAHAQPIRGGLYSRPGLTYALYLREDGSYVQARSDGNDRLVVRLDLRTLYCNDNLPLTTNALVSLMDNM